MKSLFKLAALVSGAIVLFASCEKEAVMPKPSVEVGEGEHLIIVNAVKDVTVNQVSSRTLIDGAGIKWATSGEKLKVYEVKTPTEGDAVTSARESSEGVTSDSGSTMSFAVNMPEAGEGTFAFDYYAFYPYSAYASGSAVTNIAINTSAIQTPSANSFDPAADLLIAKPVANGASQADNLNMQFGRAVAIGIMTIKNLESTDPVTKITFSAKEGENAIKLAGRTAFNLSEGSLVNTYGGNVGETSIILDVEALNSTANSDAGMTTYFTSYPFAINSENPGSFKVVVETASQSFTKEVSVSSPKGLAFNAGKASIFAVDMDNIEGQNKNVDLCYAYLEYSDVSGQLTNSYGNASVTKTHGDRWSMYATNASSSVIALKNGDASSYIKLPDFEDDITSVTVTLSEVTATKTLTFDSTQGGNSGDLGEVAFVAGTLEYTVDLSSANVKTAYIHSNGSQAKIVNVEVVAGSDTRTAIDAPATVTAALNDDDVDVTNSIDVSWSAVDGATGYVLTLVPDSGDDVIKHVGAVTSTTVEDLQYEMDYLVSVQAEPADYYLNKISAQTTYGDIVTTGTAPSGAITLTENEIAASGSAVKGTNNGKLAYRVGTGSNTGTLTFDAGYESITFTITGFGSSVSAFSITNGTIGGADSYNPGTGNASGTLNAGFSTSYAGNEVTITVTDPTEQVVITGKRYVLWGFTAVESTPDTRDDASLAWKKGGVAANSDTASLETGDDTLPTIALDNSAHSHPVTYSSSNTDVATIVASGVGAGTITLVAAGETTISAIFAGDEDYKPLTVTYTLTVSDNRTQVAVPTFSPAAGAVEANQVVTFLPADQGLTFHYTVDGNDPVVGTSSTGASVTITSAMTVKVIATKADYKPSNVASAAYTIAGASYDFETVAELNGLVTSTSTSYNGYLTDAVVSFVPAANTAIVKDATGSVMVYKSGHGLLQGQTYTGEITVTAIKYNSLYSEITAWSNATFTGDQTTVAPESVALSSLIGHFDDYQNAYVSVAGLTVVSTSTNNNKINVNVTDGNNNYVVYDNTGSTTCGAGDIITAVGTITKYSTTEEIKVWSASDITVTGSAPKAVTFTQPTGAAATAGCSIAVTVGGNPHTSGNTVASGTTVTLTATAGTDYEFTSWNVTGATPASTTSASTTFTMGTSAVSISATFTSTGGGEPTEKQYYILNTATTAIATSNSYNSYANQSCATGLASPGSYPSTATWSVTCGSKQTNSPAGLWLGSNNNQKAKMILSTGSIAGASAIASAIGVTTSATYYAAMICHTSFANITKVVLERTSTAGTAPSDVYLLRSTDGGTTYTLVERKADAASLTFTIASPAASAIYAIAIHSTGYCQYKVPVVTFYTTDNN